MSFTRFHDDPARIKKSLEEVSRQEQYIFNTPGVGGEHLPFINDPHVRLQKWGANVQTNTTNLESDLRGLNRSINRDDKLRNNYKVHASVSKKVHYPELKSEITSQSLASHPAWLYRDLSHYRPQHLFLNPQENVCFQFDNNLDTNILEKDHYNLKLYKKI